MKLGCTSFSWETKDNKHLLGRTYDQFGNLDANKIVVIPKNYTIKLENNTESTAVCNAKYSLIGMGVMGAETPIMVDALNDSGLMGALLYYPEFAKYDTQLTEKSININPGFFVTYILSQFSTVGEIILKIKDINLTNEDMFGEKIPVHYIFSDRSGETIIIEPDKNGINIHRNSIGVLSNSPDYAWQKNNLRNYMGITNEPRKSQNIVNFEISEFGEGSGALGLPGDYTPVSRFIRIAFLKQFSVKGNDEIDGVTKMFNNFASVTIPEGIIKAVGHEYYEKTLCLTSMCSESLMYYFVLSTNRRIQAVDLNLEKDNLELKLFDLIEEEDISVINKASIDK